ncbi:hypothetical protein BU24DRAFT_472277 [Aaosphaeria arxii CBS 175.79]|uniref:Heterokaryon incompatibility domain-containing protein n=1 Tax=Aaosphaeria arxii CBS 175.79 TaxID=1450172 RepID=A0A6A5XDZ3_9PLEO|nr:uncharacterized protein BU24DRAFT_472277 [Aaosphaeria arxii CBS 175.79]KAF2011119.1 hypothetical protein BU24DRAFT_472277 [Aaosphaeria arxii CBS 175.79]
MVIPMDRIIIKAARAERRQKKRAESKLKHRECCFHASGHLDISADRPETQPSSSEELERYKKQMTSKGWCQHQVEHLSRTYDVNTFSYLASLERSPKRLADHNRCSNYSASMKSKYIAISHVWADGLGNPSENGLPLCQVKRLRANLLKLQRLLVGDDANVLFWMDTLCIPVGPDEYSLRLVQIDKMASIYKRAMTSLVLDAELMATVSDDNFPSAEPHDVDTRMCRNISRELSLEARARLTCSVWMCRSWTLQEGELPATIAVQFLDNSVVLGRTSNLNGTYCERFTDGLSSNLQIPGGGLETNSPDPDLRSTHEQSDSTRGSHCECVDIVLQRTLFETFFREYSELATVWNELSGRSTTMSNDLPIIITNILDLDNRNLLTYHDTADMFQAILLSLKRLPMSLFFNTGPRKSGNHQNRWVPIKIGADTLALENQLVVRRNHLLYRHRAEDTCSNLSVFTINKILSLKSTVYLHSASENVFYTAELPGDSADPLDTEGYTSTCVIIENVISPSDPDVRKGACFYARPKRKIDYRRGLRGRRLFCSRGYVETPGLELTFLYPIRLRKSGIDTLQTVNQERILLLNSIDECDIKINYGISSFLVNLFGSDN